MSRPGSHNFEVLNDSIILQKESYYKLTVTMMTTVYDDDGVHDCVFVRARTCDRVGACV